MQNRSLADYKELFGFDKPAQLILILFQALWTLWLASAGFPTLNLFFVFLSGIIIVYALCHTVTTANTAFSKKQIRNYSGLFAIVVIAILALTNWLTWIFAIIGFALACLYFWVNKKSFWKNILSGLAIAWFVPLIFTAQKEMLPHISWVIYLAIATWTITANYLGTQLNPNLLVAALIQIVTFMLLMLTGIIYGQGLFYFIALLIVLIVFICQLGSLQKKQRERHYRWIYLSHSWLGGLVFISTVINYYY